MSNDNELDKKIDDFEARIDAEMAKLSFDVDKFLQENAAELQRIAEQLEDKSNNAK